MQSTAMSHLYNRHSNFSFYRSFLYPTTQFIDKNKYSLALIYGIAGLLIAPNGIKEGNIFEKIENQNMIDRILNYNLSLSKLTLPISCIAASIGTLYGNKTCYYLPVIHLSYIITSIGAVDLVNYFIHSNNNNDDEKQQQQQQLFTKSSLKSKAKDVKKTFEQAKKNVQSSLLNNTNNKKQDNNDEESSNENEEERLKNEHNGSMEPVHPVGQQVLEQQPELKEIIQEKLQENDPNLMMKQVIQTIQILKEKEKIENDPDEERRKIAAAKEKLHIYMDQ